MFCDNKLKTLLLTILLAALYQTTLMAAPQSRFTQYQNQSSYVHWTLKNIPAVGFRGFNQTVQVSDSGTSQFYASRFLLRSDPAWGVGGYIGLQTNVSLPGRSGRGKAAIFSMWGATRTEYIGGSKAHRCNAFDAVSGDPGAVAEGGFGRSCLIALNWADAQVVNVSVANVNGRWYTGSVQIGGVNHPIARYFVPNTFPRWIKDSEPNPANRLMRASRTNLIDYVENFLEDFSPSSSRECKSDDHRVWVRWSAPRPTGSTASFDKNRVDNPDRNCYRIQQHVHGTNLVTLRSDPLGSYVKTATRRLYDSRVSGGELARNSRRTVSVRQCGWSQARTAAVVLTVKAVKPRGTGFITAYAPPMIRSTGSTLNYSTGDNTSSQLTILPDKSGNVVFKSSAPTHLVVDCMGRYDVGRSTGKISLLSSQARLVDTRSAGNRPIFQGEERRFTVTGRHIPSGASAAILNITALRAPGRGYLTAFEWGDQRNTTVSSMNYPGHTPRSSQIIVPISSGGSIGLYSSAQTDVIIDVVGWVGSPIRRGLYKRATVHSYRTYDSRYDGGRIRGRKTIELGNLPSLSRGAEVNITVSANVIVDVTGYLER